MSRAAGAIAEYNRGVARDPAAALEQAAWLEAAFLQAGITFDGAPMRSFLRPHLVERAEWDRLRDTGRQLLEMAARVARRVFDGDARRLCAYLGIPEAEARWIPSILGSPTSCCRAWTPSSPRKGRVSSR